MLTWMGGLSGIQHGEAQVGPHGRAKGGAHGATGMGEPGPQTCVQQGILHSGPHGRQLAGAQGTTLLLFVIVLPESPSPFALTFFLRG